MGIRYYAYAFDAASTDLALADPRSFTSADPLADAWGMPHGFTSGTTDFRQAVPERDMLYLDKAWSDLQVATGPGAGDTPARPAYRMFEGQVTHAWDGWEAWVRVLTPDEVRAVANDLESLADDEVRSRLRGKARYKAEAGDEAGYALHHLAKARTFVAGLAAEGRGMVYLIA